MDRTKEALDSLYKANYKCLYQIALNAVHNPDNAMDLVQETFKIACEKSNECLSSPNPHGWLVIAIGHVIGNYIQKQPNIMKYIVPLADWDQPTEMLISVAKKYEGLIESETLSLLIWVYCQERPYQEIADKLDISLSACKKRIQRAKEKFRTEYEKKFIK